MKFQIREARENAGYSQKELAKIIGVAQNTFHGYESGKHDPKPDLLIKIAQACGTTVDFLLGHKTEQRQDVDIERISNTEKNHIKKYRSLDPYGKEAVSGILDVESRRCEADRKEQKDKATPDLNDRLNDEEKEFMRYVSQLNHKQQEMLLEHLQKVLVRQQNLPISFAQVKVDGNTP